MMSFTKQKKDKNIAKFKHCSQKGVLWSKSSNTQYEANGASQYNFNNFEVAMIHQAGHMFKTAFEGRIGSISWPDY